MKYINLNQHWEIDRVKNPTADSNEKLTADWLLNGIAAGYKQGFKNGDARRMFVSFKDKIMKAIKDKMWYIEINPIEEIFIKNGFDQCGSDPQTATWINIAENAFLTATSICPEKPAEEKKVEPITPNTTEPKK